MNCLWTLDKPIDKGLRDEDGITYKRMKKAVELVNKAESNDPHEIVDNLMDLFPEYALKESPAVPAEYFHPKYKTRTNSRTKGRTTFGGAWVMADYISQTGECQAIVRFVRGSDQPGWLSGRHKSSDGMGRSR